MAEFVSDWSMAEFASDWSMAEFASDWFMAEFALVFANRYELNHSNR